MRLERIGRVGGVDQSRINPEETPTDEMLEIGGVHPDKLLHRDITDGIEKRMPVHHVDIMWRGPLRPGDVDFADGSGR